MEVAVEHSTGMCSVYLTGDLTVAVAQQAKRELLAPIDSADAVRLDLSQLTGIDTAGLQLLVLACQHARRLGKSLQIECASAAAQELFCVYGLSAFLGCSGEAIG